MNGKPTTELINGDCLTVLKGMPDKSIDLVFGSPPYENCRTYGIDFNITGQAWVDWMVKVYQESARVCKGLVAFVVEGKTRNFQWTATPALLMADLHRAGLKLRKPPIYQRVGIPGSGGPDWLRNDYEFVICVSDGKLPWSDNIAMGKPPKYEPGGNCSNRQRNGSRTAHGRSGDKDTLRIGSPYIPPAIANPGNIINCKAVGGGHLGSDLAHENEAPFPEKLAEFFIRSFCPPDGIVCDPFSGSGTSLAVAKKYKRNGIGIDIRQSQIDLARRRIDSTEQGMFG